MKKYELTSETKVVFGCTLHRIRALASFGTVKARALGFEWTRFFETPEETESHVAGL